MTLTRLRCTVALVALLAAIAAAAPAGHTATPGATQKVAFPTLYVHYSNSCTFTVVDDNGNLVTALAPGTYGVYVDTPTFYKLLVPGSGTAEVIAPDDWTGATPWGPTPEGEQELRDKLLAELGSITDIANRWNRTDGR